MDDAHLVVAKPKEPAAPVGGDHLQARLKRHVLHEDWFTWNNAQKAEFLKTEILLGITICFAQIPESVAFAFMAHIKPPVALHAAWVVGLICTLFGGRSGMVNGAEGAFAAIIATYVAEPEVDGQNGEGVELLFPSVMVAGFIMLVVWFFKFYRFITLIGESVMDGFCCGLAVVIGRSQLHPFYVGHGSDKKLMPVSDTLGYMLLIMITSMLVMEFIPKLPFKGATLLPSSLLAILSAIFIEYAIVRNVGGRTDVIGDVTPFDLTYPVPFFVDTSFASYDLSLITADKAGQIVVQGLFLALAGVIQGLMTVQVVTSYIKTPAKTDAVVWSMGLANLVSGFFGGMGGDAMIGLSTINCLNGGRGRLGPTVTALGIAICVMAAYPVLDYIPVSALAGVMIVVVVHTFRWARMPMLVSACLPEAWRAPANDQLRKLLRGRCTCLLLPIHVDRWEALIIVVVTILTILINLVYGVAAGVVLATVRFAWEESPVTIMKGPVVGDGREYYLAKGKLYFGSAMKFSEKFDVEGDPDQVQLVLREPPTDYSAHTALGRLKGQYAEVGKEFKWSVRSDDAAPAAHEMHSNGEVKVEMHAHGVASSLHAHGVSSKI